MADDFIDRCAAGFGEVVVVERGGVTVPCCTSLNRRNQVRDIWWTFSQCFSELKLSICIVRSFKTGVCVYQVHGVVDLFCRNTWFHHHGCNVQDFSCQLRVTIYKPTHDEWITNTHHGNRQSLRSNTRGGFQTLPCTPLSFLRYPRHKVFWFVTSPSETARTRRPLREANNETAGIMDLSILSEDEVLTQTGPHNTAAASQSISDHDSWI